MIGRISTGQKELDKFFGGGLPRGATTVIYGIRGSGKSRLTLQWAFGSKVKATIYEAEEEAERIDARAVEMELSSANHLVMRAKVDDIDKVAESIEETRPDLVEMNSWQKFWSRYETKRKGSFRQMAYVYDVLAPLVVKYNFALVLTSHANTRDGRIKARPELEHEVDSTLARLIKMGARKRKLKIDKSRTGSDDEIVLAFDDKGRLFPVPSKKAPPPENVIPLHGKGSSKSKAHR